MPTNASSVLEKSPYVTDVIWMMHCCPAWEITNPPTWYLLLLKAHSSSSLPSAPRALGTQQTATALPRSAITPAVGVHQFLDEAASLLNSL